MIRINDLSFSYGDKQIFDRLTLTLPEKGAVCLMGKSGCGKSTLLKLIAGLLVPDSGSITGTEGVKTAFVFQEDRLLPGRSALENVTLVSSRESAALWLRKFGITDPDALPDMLSGGMQRRVALARAMAYGGELLILDEPFKGLDEALREKVINEIRGVFPLTVVSTHDSSDAEDLNASVIRL